MSDLVMAEDSCCRAAFLTRIPESGDSDRLGDLAEIGVGVYDDRRLAAQFEMYSLQRPRGAARNGLATRHASGQGDHSYAGMTGDRLAHDGPGAKDHVEH